MQYSYMKSEIKHTQITKRKIVKYGLDETRLGLLNNLVDRIGSCMQLKAIHHPIG